MPCYFIDVKGFVGNGNVILFKELCILNANNVLKPFHQVYSNLTDWDKLSFSVQIFNEKLRQRLTLNWEEGKDIFCPQCIMYNFNDVTSIFYVVNDETGVKSGLLKQHFPTWRFVNYIFKPFAVLELPINITCPWREHGTLCAYKTCLLACLDYLSINEW